MTYTPCPPCPPCPSILFRTWFGQGLEVNGCPYSNFSKPFSLLLFLLLFSLRDRGDREDRVYIEEERKKIKREEIILEEGSKGILGCPLCPTRSYAI